MCTFYGIYCIWAHFLDSDRWFPFLVSGAQWTPHLAYKSYDINGILLGNWERPAIITIVYPMKYAHCLRICVFLFVQELFDVTYIIQDYFTVIWVIIQYHCPCVIVASLRWWWPHDPCDESYNHREHLICMLYVGIEYWVNLLSYHIVYPMTSSQNFVVFWFVGVPLIFYAD